MRLSSWPKFKDDRDVVLKAVGQNGMALRYASGKLRNDEVVVLVAVEKYGLALQHASTTLRNERGVVLAAVKNDGEALLWAEHKDVEVVREALRDRDVGLNIRYYRSALWYNCVPNELRMEALNDAECRKMMEESLVNVDLAV